MTGRQEMSPIESDESLEREIREKLFETVIKFGHEKKPRDKR